MKRSSGSTASPGRAASPICSKANTDWSFRDACPVKWTGPDLRAATAAALATGLHVAQVEQPYRVAGRRAPAPAAQLDAAWLAVVAAVVTTALLRLL